MNFTFVTLFSNLIEFYFKDSILKKAINEGSISIDFYNPRDFIKDKKGNGYRPVDDKPYGGGPGMVMRAQPLLRAVAKVLSLSKEEFLN